MQDQTLNQLAGFLDKKDYSGVVELCCKQQEINPINATLHILRLIAICKCDDVEKIAKISGLECMSDYHFLRKYADDCLDTDDEQLLNLLFEIRKKYKASLIDKLKNKKKSYLDELRKICGFDHTYIVERIKELFDAIAVADKKLQIQIEIYQKNTAEIIQKIKKKAKDINDFIPKKLPSTMTDEEFQNSEKKLMHLMNEYEAACLELKKYSYDKVDSAFLERRNAVSDVNIFVKELYTKESVIQNSIRELKNKIQECDIAINEVTEGTFNNAVNLLR